MLQRLADHAVTCHIKWNMPELHTAQLLDYLSQVTSQVTSVISTRYSGRPSRGGRTLLLIRDVDPNRHRCACSNFIRLRTLGRTENIFVFICRDLLVLVQGAFRDPISPDKLYYKEMIVSMQFDELITTNLGC